MRNVLLGFLFAMISLTSNAGAIARQYGSGFEGVSWGDSLAELMAKRPGGDHYFAVGGGQREYSVPDEYYFFDETDSVVSVSVIFPYEQRAKLLGTLTLSFGPYQRTYTKGISNYYFWPRDDGTTIILEETLDPSYGI